MKDEEVVAALAWLREQGYVVARRSCGRSTEFVDELVEADAEQLRSEVAALEANPPLEAPVLAEVEGQLVLGGDGNYRMGVCFRAEDVFVLDSTNPIPVTVTIRGRGDVPEPPAISSSIR